MGGPEMDWNVQCDTEAALTLANHDQLTMVTLPATLKAHLCASDLPRLAASGPLGRLLARQARAHAEEFDMPDLGRAHVGLPDDLVNFQCDPVAVAVSLGWLGAVVEEMSLRPLVDNDVLRFEPDDDGKRIRVIVDIDGTGFAESWITSVEAAQRGR